MKRLHTPEAAAILAETLNERAEEARVAYATDGGRWLDSIGWRYSVERDAETGFSLVACRDSLGRILHYLTVAGVLILAGGCAAPAPAACPAPVVYCETDAECAALNPHLADPDRPY